MSNLSENSGNEALQQAEDWIANFLSKPNANLGRSGHVCPYTGTSKEHGMMSMEQSEIQPDEVALKEVLLSAKQQFEDDMQSVTDSSQQIFSSKVIVLPNFTTKKDMELMDRVQSALKIEFMQGGLMLGQFHPYRETAGLHSPNFFPHKSPVPLFAMRNMIQSDHVFIEQGLSDREDIQKATRAFLQRYGSVLPQEVLERCKSLIGHK